MEGDRQQHGDGRHRADAGQHADQRADHAAEQRVEQVLEGDGDAQAEREIVQEIHLTKLRAMTEMFIPSPTLKTRMQRIASTTMLPMTSVSLNSSPPSEAIRTSATSAGQQAGALEQQREADDADRHHGDRLPLRRLDRSRRRVTSATTHDDAAQRHHDVGEHVRHVARPHADRGAHRRFRPKYSAISPKAMNISPDKKSLLRNRLNDASPDADSLSVDFGPETARPTQTLDKHDFAASPKPQLHSRISNADGDGAQAKRERLSQ